MGRRNRLEAIRSANEDVRDQDEGAGPALQGGEQGSAELSVAAVRPWLAIWLHPRLTIRHVVRTPLGAWWFLPFLAIPAGISRGLRRAVANELGRGLDLPELLAAASAWGAVFGLLTVVLGGAALAGCLRLFGGRGSLRHVCSGVAWGMFPQAIMLLLWIPLIASLGLELFLPHPVSLPIANWLRWLLTCFLLVDLTFVLWSAVLVWLCVAEVSKVKLWRVFVASVLAVGLIYAGLVLFFLVAPSWLKSPRAGFKRPIEPVRTGAIGKVDPRWPMGRNDPAPPAGLGPVAMKIWQEGYAIRGNIDAGKPGRPVVALHITSGYPGVTSDVLRYLPELPDLKQLSLFGGEPFTDQSLRRLSSLKHLELLSIGGNKLVTDKGLESLAGNPNLRELRLVDCPHVTGALLGRHASAQRLETLFLYKCGITKKGVEAIGALASLRTLTVFIAPLDDASLAPLARLKKLTKLELQSLPINGSGLSILTELPALQTLDLFGCELTDAAIEPLCALKSLQKLNLEQTTLTKAESERISQAIPNWKINYIRPRARAE